MIFNKFIGDNKFNVLQKVTKLTHVYCPQGLLLIKSNKVSFLKLQTKL